MPSERSLLLNNEDIEGSSYSTWQKDRSPDTDTLRGTNTQKRKWTRDQILTAVTLAAMTLSQGIGFGIIAPFFPSEAAEKGASSAVIGLVFGVYELVTFITSPIYGSIIHKVGARFMCLSSSFLLGGCSIAFGFLDRCPDGPVYIAMCFLCRIVEGNAAAMVMTSSFAIMAVKFPKEIGTAVGIIETTFGLGLVLGPTIGGSLYSVGGFVLPFVVIGGGVLVTYVAGYFTLPKIDDVPKVSRNIFSLLKVPGCVIIYVVIVCCGISLSFLDPTFNPFIEHTFPEVTVPQIGLLLSIGSGVYALLGPIVGYISDKWIQGVLCFGGLILEAIAFFLFGPNPWLATFIPTTISETVVALVILGIGAIAIVIPTYPIIHRIARNEGFPDNVQTYGLVSGLFTSAFSLGAFLGPTVAGYLAKEYGFAWSASICAFINLGGAVLLGTYMCGMRVCGRWPIPLPEDTDDGSISDVSTVSTDTSEGC